MKIALSWINAGSPRSGLEVFAREFYRALGRTGGDHRYLVTGSFWRDYRRRARETRSVLPPAFETAFRRRPRNIEQYLHWRRLAPGPEKGLLRAGISLYHGIDETLPPLKRLPGIITVHDIGFRTHPEWFASSGSPLAWHRFLGESLAGSRAVCAISDYTRREIIDFFALPRKKVRVIYYGGAAGFFRPLDPGTVPGSFRARHRLDGRFILSVAPSAPHKNIPALVSAFGLISGRCRDLKLVLAGPPGADHDRVVSIVRSGGLADRVVFVPRVENEELAFFYNLATAFVFPSLYEGFGLPVLEAMACGCPAMVSRAACLPEIAGDGALLFDPESPSGLAAAMEKVIASAVLRAELRNRGLARAKQFSWDKTARETLALYRETAGG